MIAFSETVQNYGYKIQFMIKFNNKNDNNNNNNSCGVLGGEIAEMSLDAAIEKMKATIILLYI